MPPTNEMDLPSSQESLRLSDLSDTEVDRMIKDLGSDVGGLSSDGEFTKIAKQELKHDPNLTEEWKVCRDSSEELAQPVKSESLNITGGVVKLEMDLFTPFNCATGSSPSMQPWSGDYDFNFRVKDAKKSKDPHYSSLLNKLYINQNHAVEIFFSLKQPCPNGLYVRSVVVFTKDDDFREPVKVCHSHSINSDGHLINPIGDHLMKLTDTTQIVRYGKDPQSDRHFLLAKLPDLQAGSCEVSVGYKFSDLGSCPGGLNRRETAVIFTLEKNGEVCGRQVLGLRICTSPRRDKTTDEEQYRRHQLPPIPLTSNIKHEVVGSSPNSRNFQTGNGKRKFWVLANGEENFSALCQIAEVLEKKDGGDLKNWRETVASHNGLTNSLKKKKTNQ